MCGIVGIINLDGRPVEESELRSMANRLTHRGPDDEGYWCDGPVGFGHRRLSIIDISGSHQPMATNDGRHHIAFNGEILNYRELRNSLRYDFRTKGDTETALALLATRGPKAVDELEGQFAIAIHDAASGEVHLFRDRMGILPLYYAIEPGRFVFASEIKALLPALSNAPRVDYQSVVSYLGRRSVPAPYSLFEGVLKVRPGHHITIDRRGRVTEAAWWSPRVSVDDHWRAQPNHAVDVLDETLHRAVRRALVADVPVGAYLSGGVDSSLISAVATREHGAGQLETFSAGFDDERVDETGFARAVSQHLGTNHHEVVVRPEDFRASWSDLTWHRDAPLSEPADVAVHRLASLARQHVKVVLSGEGSDELFAGYPKYKMAALGRAVRVAPQSRAMARWLARRVPHRRARVAFRAFGAEDEGGALEAWFSPFPAEERLRLVRPELLVLSRPDPTILRGSGAINRMTEWDCQGWLADNLLERGDRMSMAASLELRPPFLDRELVELALTLPPQLKLRSGTTKWIVKEVARRYLPPQIVDRPKRGFQVPLDAWFRGELQTFAEDLLLRRDGLAAEVFNRGALEELLRDHASGRRDEAIQIWTLVGLEVWYDTFFRGAHQRVEGEVA